MVNQCQFISLILMLVYAIPVLLDIFPSSDSYLGGIGFLGIWGTGIATLLGAGISMYYGSKCVSEKTVYRCLGWGCDKDNANLVFPENFSDELKKKYVDKLSGIPQDFKSHLPLSKFNKELVNLNQTLL